MTARKNVGTPPSLEKIYSRCIEIGDCRIWQQSCINGNPQMTICGKGGQLVRRYIFSQLLGRNIKRGYVVVARCREPQCVAAECLITITYSERLRRAYRDGSRSTAAEYLKRVKKRIDMGTTVLDFAKAKEIRNRRDERAVDLAREYGVDPKTINTVWRGESWRDQAPNNSVFNQRA